MKIESFNKPDFSVKSVLLHFHGKFPQAHLPTKDVTLAHRLWPNAKLIIRCNTDDEETKTFFAQAMKNIDYELVSQKLNCLRLDVDVIFMHQHWWIFFGGVIEKKIKDDMVLLAKTNKPVYLFYNDEDFQTIEPLHEVIDRRVKANINFAIRNQSTIDELPRKTNWSNFHVIANTDMLQPWVNNKISDSLKESDMTLHYLSDLLLYDIPERKNLDIPTSTKYNRGIYIAYYSDARIKALHSIFKKESNVVFLGALSEKLNPYLHNVHTSRKVPNTSVRNILATYKYSIYVGKGTESMYLGATFYEPLLAGLPVFVWTGTDSNKKVFPGLDCYFSTQDELEDLVKNTNLDELWDKQMNIIYTRE